MNTQATSQSIVSKVLLVVASMILFLFSIELMGSSIGVLTGDFTENVSTFTANPFIGLFIGLLSTALLQSSSTTTSIVVAAVASGAISLQHAIPMVLGANIGTTITSTIISLSYISKHKEFRKAVAAGTSHDFFNILTVFILFPLEVEYRILERLSDGIASLISPSGKEPNIEASIGFTSYFDVGIQWIIATLGSLLALIVGIVLLFSCIKFISSWLYKILIGKTKDQFENVVFKTRYRSFSWGLLITSLAQSSSLTTSLIVPLVATGKVKVKQAFHFIMGANIGTTITALLAAVFQSQAAISLALVHLLFNLFGVLLFFIVPYATNVPIYLAKKMGKITGNMRLVGFAYIFLAFFLIPFTLIYISKSTEKPIIPIEVHSED